jgi:hypothetical protein
LTATTTSSTVAAHCENLSVPAALLACAYDGKETRLGFVDKMMECHFGGRS